MCNLSHGVGELQNSRHSHIQVVSQSAVLAFIKPYGLCILDKNASNHSLGEELSWV